MKVYVAGPFFVQEQIKRVNQVIAVLEGEDIEFFSPKDANLWKPGDDPFRVLKGNTDAIDSCDTLIAITDDKDTGTMFEAGYAYAKYKRIIYMWFEHLDGQRFNLMLGCSGAVARDINELVRIVRVYKAGEKMQRQEELDLE